MSPHLYLVLDARLWIQHYRPVRVVRNDVCVIAVAWYGVLSSGLGCNDARILVGYDSLRGRV